MIYHLSSFLVFHPYFECVSELVPTAALSPSYQRSKDEFGSREVFPFGHTGNLCTSRRRTGTATKPVLQVLGSPCCMTVLIVPVCLSYLSHCLV